MRQSSTSDYRPGDGPTPGTGPTGILGRMTGAVSRAQEDLVAGRAWKARDRLVGYLAESRDPEALSLLGEVLYVMGDLPAAGAAWFGTARRGDDVDTAISAWRERYADQFGEMYKSLPRSVRQEPRIARVEALRHKAIEQDEASGRPPRVEPGPGKAARAAQRRGAGGLDSAVVIALALAAVVLVSAVVGFVTILKWMLPG